MAVYNGEKYLKQQIESVLNQTVSDIKIIVRDDGSTDNSKKIIDSFCNEYPQKITKIEGEPTGSAKKNFAKLFEAVDDDYIMFCDQDDIWLPDKVEKTLSAIKTAENGGTTPVLVHTDLKVVDQSLNVISNSFFNFQQLIQKDITLPKLLVQNYVTGCTVMINRALLEKCATISDECIMHDWWLALTSVLFGKLVCLSESTILYRQHSNNQVGAKASYGIDFVKRKLKTLGEVKANYNATYIQAEALLKCYKEQISKQNLEILQNYCNMKNMKKFKKIRIIKKYGFKKCTTLRVLGQYFLV